MLQYDDLAVPRYVLSALNIGKVFLSFLRPNVFVPYVNQTSFHVILIPLVLSWRGFS